MGFTNPIIGGADVLIRPAIQSPDYETGVAGWSINKDGSAEFQQVNAAGVITVQGDDGIVQALDGSGNPVASLDATGTLSGAKLTISSSDVEFNGQSLDEILDHTKTAWLAYGSGTDTGSSTGEIGAFEIAFEAPETKKYFIDGYIGCYSTVNNCLIGARVRDGGASKPSTSSTLIVDNTTAGSTAYTGMTCRFSALVTLTAGTHRLLISVYPYTGGTVYLSGNHLLVVSHFDGSLVNLAVSNSGGGGSSTPVQQYTTQWAATWSGSYGGDNAYNGFYGNEAHQGYYSSSEGNQRSLIGFDSSSITSTLSGATILGCTITLYAFHWYWNSGGIAVIGTHNLSSLPGTFGSAWTNRIQSGGWPKPGLRTVDLGAGIGGEFQSGATKGIALGPGPSTSFDYYGKFYGAGQSYAPVLTITYQK